MVSQCSRLTRALVGAALLLAARPAPAHAQLKDLAGSKDHPLMSRYADSVIIAYEQRRFDELALPMGPIARREPGSMDLIVKQQQPVEGRVTRILYVAPANRSPLEVLRNYEQALTKGGFKTAYTCAREQCGLDDGWLGKFFLYHKQRKMTNNRLAENAFSFPVDQRYLVSKLSRAEGDVYASVYAATETFDALKEVHNRTLTLVELVETTPMESNMVTVDAGAMAKDIEAAGHVALYGIYFDTDSADIKPASAPTLAEIAKLLKQDAGLSVYVVGHTDNVGGYDYNLALSQRRAESVVKALTGTHGVAVKRLRAAGVGLLGPVAPNETEQGRAKNRRVELVRQ